MGHAASQGAERFHLLGTLKFLLHLDFAGDIPVDGNKADDVVFAVSYGRNGDLELTDRVIFLFGSDSSGPHLSGCDALPHRLIKGLRMMITSEDISVLTNDLLLGVVGNFFKRRVCV